MKILYIAGSGRSGSTLFGQLLGQIDGFFSVGEASNIWERGLVARRRCACGEPFPECPVWSAILADAFPGGTPLDARRLAAIGRERDRARSVLRVAASGRAPVPAGDAYLRTVRSLYASMERVTGSRVIVDSSKSPFYAEWIDRVGDVRVVHLVRDPRAAAYSWLRKKKLPDFGDDRLMIQQSAVVSARRWDKAQALTELLWRRATGRYIFVKYEDFMRDPESALRGATALVGEGSAELPLIDARSARVAKTHAVSGNPDRFQEGTVELRSDDEWKTMMTTRDRRVVTAITWPLLLRYGYPITTADA
jgi:hypothetical protein